jgi:8-oxo-dGTP pyrophosphatase MutT (NUDIX family)
MKAWTTLSRHTILDRGKFLRIENHVIELPDGRVISDWPWVVTPDFINVVAQTDAGEFLCFRQTKYAVAGLSLAVVGGYLDPGETPLAAAQRELLEETGYEATDWIDLGHYPVDGNRGAGTAHLFLARGAYPVTDPDADDLEEQEVLHLSRAEVETALAAGEFKLLSWAAAVALALRRLDGGS